MSDEDGSVDSILEGGSLTLGVAKRLIRSQQKQNVQLQEQIAQLQAVIDELQKRNPTQRLEESYSAEAEARRKAREQQAAARKKKKG